MPQSVPRVLVLADDLTGAADAGVPFATRGLATMVHLGAHLRPAGEDAVALDLDTRSGGPEQARSRVREAAARHQADRADVTFGKLDSLLRGHLLAGLQGLREAVPGALVVLAPAFPAAGRTTVGGEQLVHGRRSDPALLRLLAPLDVAHLDLARVRGQLAAKLARVDRDVALLDAETDDDLDRIVRAARDSGRTVVWAGSAGLARAVAEDLNPLPGRPSRAFPAVGPGATLTVIGSASQIAQAQAASLVAAGATLVAIPAERLAGGDTAGLDDLRRRVNAAAGIGDVVVSVIGPVSAARSAEVLAGLVVVVREAAHAAPLLALTGGATARAVLLARGVDRLALVAEPEPGIVLSHAPEHDLTIVTKAGAFGDAHTLTRAVQAVRRGAAP